MNVERRATAVQHLVLHWVRMPTRRRRHMITEVGDVAEALDRVRESGGEPDVRRLIVLGAETVVSDRRRAQADAERRAALRESLIARTTAPARPAPGRAVAFLEGAWTRNLLDD